MQSLDKRITSLETAKAKGRPFQHLTDAELDMRLALLQARIAATEEADHEGKQHAED